MLRRPSQCTKRARLDDHSAPVTTDNSETGAPKQLREHTSASSTSKPAILPHDDCDPIPPIVPSQSFNIAVPSISDVLRTLWR